MVTKLPLNSPSERHWNFNDAVGRNYMLYIPANQPGVTATLNWKKSSDSKAILVGKYRFDLRALEAGGFVRFKDNRYFLRFQRTKERIEIAINRSGKAQALGRMLIARCDLNRDGEPGEPMIESTATP